MTSPDSRCRDDGRFFHIREFQEWRPVTGNLDDLAATEFEYFVQEARQILVGLSDDEIDDLAHYATVQATMIQDLEAQNHYLYWHRAEAFSTALFSPISQLLSRLQKPVEHYFAALVLAIAAHTIRNQSDNMYGEMGAAARWMRAASHKHGLSAKQSRPAGVKEPASDVGINARVETTYLNIIGGLLDLMLGRTPADKPQSVFESQAAIVDALLAHHRNKPGISQRTLDEKFPKARNSISQ